MKDIDVISETLVNVRRMEKVFQAAGVPYFTDGSVDWSEMEHNASESKSAGKKLINWEDMKAWILENDLLDALTQEFNLESSPKDFITWMEGRKAKRSQERKTPTG